MKSKEDILNNIYYGICFQKGCNGRRFKHIREEGDFFVCMECGHEYNYNDLESMPLIL